MALDVDRHRFYCLTKVWVPTETFPCAHFEVICRPLDFHKMSPFYFVVSCCWVAISCWQLLVAINIQQILEVGIYFLYISLVENCPLPTHNPCQIYYLWLYIYAVHIHTSMTVLSYWGIIVFGLCIFYFTFNILHSAFGWCTKIAKNMSLCA